MSALTAFSTQLINFFEELCNTFPEERDIKMALDAIKAAKKINPRLMLDLFTEHVYKELAGAIQKRDIIHIRRAAQVKLQTQFNEMISALAIFDKHWDTMGTTNQDVIWQYLKVLCLLSEKATVHAI
jgi:GTP1/Obg family GTP-binding protein